MKITSYLSTVLFIPHLIAFANAKIYDSFLDRFVCPTPEEFVEENPDYDFDCVDGSIPPWPICLFHNVTYFIDAAVASASRCCDFENLGECKCPFKNETMWRDIMMNWCPKIDKCPTPQGDVSQLVSEAWTMDVMNILMEEDGMMMEDDGGDEDDFQDEPNNISYLRGDGFDDDDFDEDD